MTGNSNEKSGIPNDFRWDSLVQGSRLTNRCPCSCCNALGCWPRAAVLQHFWWGDSACIHRLMKKCAYVHEHNICASNNSQRKNLYLHSVQSLNKSHKIPTPTWFRKIHPKKIEAKISKAMISRPWALRKGAMSIHRAACELCGGHGSLVTDRNNSQCFTWNLDGNDLLEEANVPMEFRYHNFLIF